MEALDHALAGNFLTENLCTAVAKAVKPGSYHTFCSLVVMLNKYQPQKFLRFFFVLGESLSVDPIRNCFKLLLHWNVLESHMEEKIRLYYLSEHYETNESLEPIVEKLFKYKTRLNDNE